MLLLNEKVNSENKTELQKSSQTLGLLNAEAKGQRKKEYQPTRLKRHQ